MDAVAANAFFLFHFHKTTQKGAFRKFWR